MKKDMGCILFSIVDLQANNNCNYQTYIYHFKMICLGLKKIYITNFIKFTFIWLDKLWVLNNAPFTEYV